MKTTLPEFGAARVLVVGDLMLDRYWHGDTSRISPEAPVPVVHVADAEERAGGAGNVALNIAALGCTATLLGFTGEDEAATALGNLLGEHAVEYRFEAVPGKATITKLRVLSRHQQLIRLDFEDGFFEADAGPLLLDFEQRLDAAGAVVLSDYGKGTLQQIPEFIARARARGVPVLVDPKGSDFSLYRGATLITPNLHEFEAVVGVCRTDEDLVEKGETLREALALDALLITRSEKGMTLLQQGRPALHLPTHAREVYDVTGAGDTVISVLAAALAAGEPLADATAWSNLAAGIVVGKLGTATVSVDELRRALAGFDASHRGVLDEPALLAMLAEARAHGESIVMTNGCFDILHAGHVAYLEQAARLGDRLIVAVNDDASVARLKGPERPVVPLAQRMAVLAGLSVVDWVVPFGEDTPERLICAVRPDILVKGGDYRPEQVAGGQCAGEVRILPFLDGHSTSRIVDSIRGGDA